MKKAVILVKEAQDLCDCYKLREQLDVIYFLDMSIGFKEIKSCNIPVISMTEFPKVYCPDKMDIVICSKEYFEIENQLAQMGIRNYYVLLDGFLYHCDSSGSMIPAELCKMHCHHKHSDERNILFVQDIASVHTHQIASAMRDNGYMVYLLYTILPSENADRRFTAVYHDIFTFYTQKALINFVQNSEFDIVHSSDASAVLTNLLLLTTKKIVIVHDTCDRIDSSVIDSIENATLEYRANTGCDGNIYLSAAEAEKAKKEYGLKDKNIYNFAEHESRHLADFYERLKTGAKGDK